MSKPVLVVMAAGLGSRYGGLKQMDPIDAEGNLIIDYSIFDAKRAGFDSVVFLIRPEMQSDFRAVIGERLARRVEVVYAYQRIDDLPHGFSVPEGREKPWGTGHALLSCRPVVHGPFAVINADDYYGPHAFTLLYQFLTEQVRADHYAMVGYQLRNTLTDEGSVARGICEMGKDGRLLRITERTRVETRSGTAVYTEDGGASWTELPGDTVASMNLWGFPSAFFEVLATRFPLFLQEALPEDPLKCEYFLPSVVDAQIQAGGACVTVLPSSDRWYGITYRNDKPVVERALQEMRAHGIYPASLWR